MKLYVGRDSNNYKEAACENHKGHLTEIFGEIQTPLSCPFCTPQQAYESLREDAKFAAAREKRMEKMRNDE